MAALALSPPSRRRANGRRQGALDRPSKNVNALRNGASAYAKFGRPLTESHSPSGERDFAMKGSSSINTSGQGFFERHSVAQSLFERSDANAVLAGPVRDAERPTFVSDQPVRALVAGLLRNAGPPAVVWRVWAVVVNAIKREILAPQIAVVRDEVSTPLPPFADGDSTGTIVLELSSLGVEAALHHPVPSHRERVARHAMRRLSRGGGFANQAAARTRLAVPQMSPPVRATRPAVANTVVCLSPIAGIARRRDDSPAAETSVDHRIHHPFRIQQQMADARINTP